MQDPTRVKRIAKQLGSELGDETFLPRVVTITPHGKPNVSEGGHVQIGIVGLAEDATGFDPQAFHDAEDMRKSLDSITGGTDLTAQTTGSVPQGVGSQESSEQTLAIAGSATIVLIVALLALIFRSVLICLMPVVVVGVMSSIATGLIEGRTRRSI